MEQETSQTIRQVVKTNSLARSLYFEVKQKHVKHMNKYKYKYSRSRLVSLQTVMFIINILSNSFTIHIVFSSK